MKKKIAHDKNPLAHFGIGKELDPEINDEFKKGLEENRKIQREKRQEKHYDLPKA